MNKLKIQSLNFKPKKFLGQHFLTNSQIIQKIIARVKKINPNKIIEIGPGLGALTHPLMKLNIPLIVIEKDTSLYSYWKNQKIQAIQGDALQGEWRKYLCHKSLLVGNLPYQIASRLLVNCSKNNQHLSSMILMFQKEVAGRICARSGCKSYGLLSVVSQAMWDISKLVEVTQKDFYPAPKVQSCVLVFQKKRIIDNSMNSLAFIQFIKLCFTHRRKFLLSQLQKQINKNLIKLAFKKLNIPESVRAEEIPVKQFIKLFHQLEKSTYNK